MPENDTFAGTSPGTRAREASPPAVGQQIDIWNRAMADAERIDACAACLPEDERYNLMAQLRRAVDLHADRALRLGGRPLGVDGLGDAVEEHALSDEAAEVAKNKLTRSGSTALWGTRIGGQGVDTGAFRDSIHGVLHKGMNASVRSVRDEPTISTWIERGTRRGVSLRKGQYQFRAAKTWIEKVVDARLTAALVKGLS